MFFGTPPFAARCLEALLEGPHPVVAVVTRPDRPAGRGLREQPSAVKQLAVARSLPVLQPASAKGPELRDAIASYAPDLGVVAAYGRILPAEVLEAVPLGFINAHASLLPALRGAAPIERAILEGYRETGVTIMQMNERMDAGDILTARAVPIDDDTNRDALTARLAEVAAELLPQAIDAIARGEATRAPQD
ncbi:MAG: methionyl-tRNA formyltransferase, partial [Deltaproteobacteria bacterium]